MEAAVEEAKSQADRNELLLWAAARGLLADTVELLAQGAEPTTFDKRRLTPVHYAAAHGHLDVLQYLATKGVDLDAEDERARMPLHHAAAAAKSPEAVRFLASKSAWLDGGDGSDDTPLHLASRCGWAAGVSLLLGAGAKHGVRNKRGLTPLGEAVAGGHAEVAKQLIAAGADPRAGAGAGYSLLHVAAGLGHAGCLKALLEAGLSPADADGAGAAADGATPLHAAAMAGSVACAEALLAKGADPLAPSADGQLPSECVEADTPLAAETLKSLLSKAADKARKAGGAGAGLFKRAAPAAAAAAPKQRDQDGKPAAAAASDAAAAASPVEAYAQVFGRLADQEQERRVDGFARMAEGELAGLDFLSPEAKKATGEVRKALNLLSCFRAVAALHRDERFQEDAADPRVHKAIAEIRESNSFEKYAADGQVVSVMGKLRKLQVVLRDAGGMRVGLEELLPGGGKTLQDLITEDTQRISELELAHAAARATAIDALLSRLPGTTARLARERGGGSTAAAGGAAATAAQLGPADEGPSAAAAAVGKAVQKAGGDEFAAIARPGAKARRGGGAKPTAVAEVVEGEAAEAGAEEEPLWKRQLKQAAKDTFHRCLRITVMFIIMTGVMWAMNMLPHQSGGPGAVMEARLEALRAELAAKQREAAAAAAAAAADGAGARAVTHAEL